MWDSTICFSQHSACTIDPQEQLKTVLLVKNGLPQTLQFTVRHLLPIYPGIVPKYHVETTSGRTRILAIICSAELSNALTTSDYDLLKFPRWQTEDYCKHYSSLTFHYAEELAFLTCFNSCYRSKMEGRLLPICYHPLMGMQAPRASEVVQAPQPSRW